MINMMIFIIVSYVIKSLKVINNWKIIIIVNCIKKITKLFWKKQEIKRKLKKYQPNNNNNNKSNQILINNKNLKITIIKIRRILKMMLKISNKKMLKKVRGLKKIKNNNKKLTNV